MTPIVYERVIGSGNETVAFAISPMISNDINTYTEIKFSGRCYRLRKCIDVATMLLSP